MTKSPGIVFDLYSNNQVTYRNEIVAILVLHLESRSLRLVRADCHHVIKGVNVCTDMTI